MNEDNKIPELVVRHEKSTLYREIVPNGFLATQVSDGNGYYIKVLVLRNDVEVVSERMKGDWDGEKLVMFDEEVIIDQRPIRIQETSLQLTPKMAVNLHAALSRELDSLPDEIANRYGIKKEDS